MATTIWYRVEEFREENGRELEAEYLGKWFVGMDFPDSDDSRFVPSTVLWDHDDFVQAAGALLAEAKERAAERAPE